MKIVKEISKSYFVILLEIGMILTAYFSESPGLGVHEWTSVKTPIPRSFLSRGSSKNWILAEMFCWALWWIFHHRSAENPSLWMQTHHKDVCHWGQSQGRRDTNTLTWPEWSVDSDSPYVHQFFDDLIGDFRSLHCNLHTFIMFRFTADSCSHCFSN